MKISLLVFVMILGFFNPLKAEDADSYVVGKVQKHDMIIFGEHHWKGDEMIFFADVIPKLYENGVKCFAFEFLSAGAQDLIDSLMYNDKYDIRLQNKVLAQWPMFFIKPNENILYTLWKLQKKIGVENEKIKVLGLTRPAQIKNIVINESDSSQVELAKNFCRDYIRPFPEKYRQMDYDSLMAKLVLDYYSESHAKVAIYCGANHGLTKAHQYAPEEYGGERIIRMGNILQDKLQDKVTNIVFMPLPIDIKDGDTKCTTPLDSILEKQGINRVGFDLNSSFLGNYVCEDIMSPRLLPHFSIKDYYDGAIYLKPRKEIDNCLLEGWIADVLPFYAKTLNLQSKKWEQEFHDAIPCNCWKNN